MISTQCNYVTDKKVLFPQYEIIFKNWLKLPTFPTLLPVWRITRTLEAKEALLAFCTLFPTWLKRKWERNEIGWKIKYVQSDVQLIWDTENNWFLSKFLIWCCTSIELRIKDDPDWTSLFVGGSWKRMNEPNFLSLPISDHPLCSPRSSDRTRWLAKQRTHWHGNSSPTVAAPLKHEL